MSRWIDADALKEKIDSMWNGRPISFLGAKILVLINDAPSIDIVRCKECKWANTEDCSHSYWDEDWREWYVSYNGDDWFCADGEREGE